MTPDNPTTKTKRSDWKHDGLRFVLFGLANTGVTYGLYCLLVFAFPAQLSYMIVYAFGVLLAYIGNARWVFQERIKASSAMIYPLMHLGQYLVTATILQLLLHFFSMSARPSLALAIVIVTPFTFFMNRILFRSRTSA